MKLKLQVFSFLVGIVFLIIATGCNTVEPDPLIEIPRDEAPAWSPDGRHIAYHHFNPDADDTNYPTGLYILNLEIGEKALVIEGPAFNPDWSPDGQWIAFDSGDIFRIRPDGSELTQITNHGSAFFPSWGPDGERIAFDSSYLNERGANTIWLIDSEGNNQRTVVEPLEGEIRNPDWSSEWNFLLHYRYIQDKIGSEIFVMDTLGNNVNRLTETDDGITNHSPSYSPDGKWIVWLVDYRRNKFGIWLMNADGSGQQEVLSIVPEHTIPVDYISPSWSSDSEKIVFSKPTNKEDKVVLWTMNRDGSGLTQITN